ncbi:MAG: DUF5777 family beta-barrel protein [Bacteroidetes bacterium]|nr:DUF5777 family beta-barrel protein [Bacteroidota bacterium]
MKRILTLAAFSCTVSLTAQEKKPVEIFTSQKVINANTTQTVGKGQMEFKVTHNFGDIAGDFGGIKNFFGLDNNVDVRIAFQTGIGKKFDLTFARSKGASKQQRLWEMGLKYQLMQQLENDASHPLSIALYANAVIASNTATATPNQDHSYKGISQRTSNAFQLILARKMGKISLQLNPTFVTRGYSISYDQKSFFSMGGAIRLPLTHRLNFIMDYFHTFRSKESKDSFRLKENVRFYNPLGVGLEVVTGRHVFHLNFTNTTEIVENRFIPRTVTSWGKGQFRWGFTISRQFTVWKEKKKKPTS